MLLKSILKYSTSICTPQNILKMFLKMFLKYSLKYSARVYTLQEYIQIFYISLHSSTIYQIIL